MSTPGPSANGTHRQSNDNSKVRMSTRIAAVFVVMVMAASCLVLVNGSNDSYADPNPYDIGGGVEYFLDSDGELTLSFTSGTGITNNYTSSDRPPWWSERYSVKKVTVHVGVVGLGNYLLAFLPNLETVQIGAVDNPNLTTIGDYCFRGDTKLTSIVAFDGAKKLPNKVTTIGQYAFKDCSSLSELALPSGLTALGVNAFDESGIASITLPSAITTVPAYCFSECRALNSVVLASSTTIISSNAFRNCTSLRTIEIMDTVTELGTLAFAGCSSLQSVHMSTALTSVASNAYSGSKFYNYDMEEISVSADNLKGKDFQRINNYYAQISDALVHEGNDYSITEDSTSVEVKATSIAYVVDKANSEASTTFKVNLSEGRVASFDCSAIKTFAAATATLRMDPMHPESIDEKTKELIGDQPVFIISFGDNTSFGDGKMTITLPYTLPEGESADELKVYCIDGGEIVEKYDCTYADGKVTFSTGHLSTYSFGFEIPSSGGKFPVWAIVLIVIVLLAAAGGAAAFFIVKNRKDGPSSDVSEPAAPVVNDASGSSSEETKETVIEEPPAPEAETVKEEQSAPAEEKAEPVAEEPVSEAPAKEEAPAPVAEQRSEPQETEAIAEPEPAVEEAPAAPVAEAQSEPEEKAPIETPAPAEEPVAEAPSEYVPAPEIKKESEPSPEKEEPATATEEKPKKKRPVSNMDDDDLDPSGSEDW